MYMWVYTLMRDVEGRKKEASKVIQSTKQRNTIHPRLAYSHILHAHVYLRYLG